MKLSIIVPVYNVEKYIVKCISSLLDQQTNDYEIILLFLLLTILLNISV